MNTCGNTPPLKIKSRSRLAHIFTTYYPRKKSLKFILVIFFSLTRELDKDKWINSERHRWAQQFNIPISQDTPPGFPVNTLPIQRTLTSLSLTHPERLESAISLFYENFWVQWNDPTKPERLSSIVKTIVGSEEEAEKVVGSTKSEEVKKKLASNTNAAFEDGAFGLPWFVGKCLIERIQSSAQTDFDSH